MAETTSINSAQSQVSGPHRELLDQVLDKWSLLILDRLCERPRRFNELRRAIGNISQKSLTASLRRLERNGMVDRVVVDTRPLAIEYRISQLGKTLQDLIDALLHWSAAHLDEVVEHREQFDAEQPQGHRERQMS